MKKVNGEDGKWKSTFDNRTLYELGKRGAMVLDSDSEEIKKYCEKPTNRRFVINASKGIDIVEDLFPGMKEQIFNGDIKVGMWIYEEIAKANKGTQVYASTLLHEGNFKEARAQFPNRRGIKRSDEIPTYEATPFNNDDLINGIKTLGDKMCSSISQLIEDHPETLNKERDRSKARKALCDVSTRIIAIINTI